MVLNGAHRTEDSVLLLGAFTNVPPIKHFSSSVCTIMDRPSLVQLSYRRARASRTHENEYLAQQYASVYFNLRTFA